jgi:hypothetical protein
MKHDLTTALRRATAEDLNEALAVIPKLQEELDFRRTEIACSVSPAADSLVITRFTPPWKDRENEPEAFYIGYENRADHTGNGIAVQYRKEIHRILWSIRFHAPEAFSAFLDTIPRSERQ